MEHIVAAIAGRLEGLASKLLDAPLSTPNLLFVIGSPAPLPPPPPVVQPTVEPQSLVLAFTRIGEKLLPLQEYVCQSRLFHRTDYCRQSLKTNIVAQAPILATEVQVVNPLSLLPLLYLFQSQESGMHSYYRISYTVPVSNLLQTLSGFVAFILAAIMLFIVLELVGLVLRGRRACASTPDLDIPLATVDAVCAVSLVGFTASVLNEEIMHVAITFNSAELQTIFSQDQVAAICQQLGIPVPSIATEETLGSGSWCPISSSQTLEELAGVEADDKLPLLVECGIQCDVAVVELVPPVIKFEASTSTMDLLAFNTIGTQCEAVATVLLTDANTSTNDLILITTTGVQCEPIPLVTFDDVSTSTDGHISASVYTEIGVQSAPDSAWRFTTVHNFTPVYVETGVGGEEDVASLVAVAAIDGSVHGHTNGDGYDHGNFIYPIPCVSAVPSVEDNAVSHLEATVEPTVSAPKSLHDVSESQEEQEFNYLEVAKTMYPEIKTVVGGSYCDQMAALASLNEVNVETTESCFLNFTQGDHTIHDSLVSARSSSYCDQMSSSKVDVETLPELCSINSQDKDTKSDSPCSIQSDSYCDQTFLRKVDVETLLKPCSINYTHGHEKPLVSMAALCPGSEYSCIALITPNDLQTGAGAENDSYHNLDHAEVETLELSILDCVPSRAPAHPEDNDMFTRKKYKLIWVGGMQHYEWRWPLWRSPNDLPPRSASVLGHRIKTQEPRPSRNQTPRATGSAIRRSLSAPPRYCKPYGNRGRERRKNAKKQTQTIAALERPGAGPSPLHPSAPVRPSSPVWADGIPYTASRAPPQYRAEIRSNRENQRNDIRGRSNQNQGQQHNRRNARQDAWSNQDQGQTTRQDCVQSQPEQQQRTRVRGRGRPSHEPEQRAPRGSIMVSR